jgi:AraC-like DNA-binding protein
VVKGSLRVEDGPEWTNFLRPPALPDTEVLHARFKSFHYAPHVHDAWTIAKMEAGAAQFDLAGITHVAPAGTIFLIPPGAVHSGSAATADGYVYRVLYLGETNSDDAGSARRLDSSTLDLRNYPVVVDHDELNKRLARLHRLLPIHGRALEQGEALESVAATITTIIRSDNPQVSSRRLGPVALAVDFIQEHWKENFTLDDLARATFSSPYQLIRMFHREFGATPSVYRRALRVAAARRLLREGLPPSSVAAKCGFYDQSHLNRHFKAAVGVTPTKYAMG